MSGESLEKRIVKQLEYYFCDINLSRDRFLMNAIKADDQSWVPIDTLLTFKRMRILCATKQLIVKAIKDLSPDLLELNESETKLRRNPNKPLPHFDDEYRKSIYERSVHLAGFPLDSTFDDLYKYCQTYGEIQAFKMNLKRTKKCRINKRKRGKDARERCYDMVFKGCIVATFASKEIAQTMLNEDLEYMDKPLLKENQIQYYERRRQFIAEKKELRLKKRLMIATSSEAEQESAKNDELNQSNDSITTGLEQITIDEQLSAEHVSEANQQN